jgi:hypothetical protein
MPRVIHCGNSPSTGSADCDIDFFEVDGLLEIPANDARHCARSRAHAGG